MKDNTKKDLMIFPGSYLGGATGLNRLSNYIFSEMDKLWRNLEPVEANSFADLQPKAGFPKVNISETEKEYIVDVALAGYDKDDVTLELKENCLYIKADKKEEVLDEGKKYLIKEISSRSFRRAFNFPKKVLTNNIGCSFTDGIITCILSKEVEVTPEDGTIKINIQ